MYNILNTQHAPQPIGPYSQAIITKDFIFISGQIPINNNAQLISNNISEQTQQSLNNIKKIVESIGLKINNIIKITLFLTDLNNIQDVNITYEKFFKKNNSKFPARTCVEVSKLPKNAKIEIDAIAIKI